MRDRFGSIGQSSNESNYNFATNGSTLSKKTLAKSASQGNLTVNEHLNSNERLTVIA